MSDAVEVIDCSPPDREDVLQKKAGGSPAKDVSGDIDIVVFACEHSANVAFEKALAHAPAFFPDGVLHLFCVPCSGRVDVIHILKAFESGADGVLVLGCFKESCNFIDGCVRAQKRADYARTLIKEIGINPDRIRFESTSPALASSIILELTGSFVDEILRLGKRINDVHGKRDEGPKEKDCSADSLTTSKGQEISAKGAPGGGMA